MDVIEITGGEPLFGEVTIQGSKNAVLPILTGTILIPGETMIHNCPKILDVYYVISILRSMGCEVTWEKETLRVNAENLGSTMIPKQEAQKMRSSIIFMGAMLGRTGEVTLPFPGGCVIGKRPIDYHLQAFRKMGAQICEKDDLFEATAKKLMGTEITLPYPSVGATENIILASVLAAGITEIKGCAREPEIVSLCEFLRGAGAKICGEGSSCITISGVKMLHATEVTIPADRIVAGTYAIAIAATRGCALLKKSPLMHMRSIIYALKGMGCITDCLEDTLWVDATEAGRRIPYLSTGVYPEFPTDLQSPMMAYCCRANGVSKIMETVFENRFRIAGELKKMGAVIETDDRQARIYGQPDLTGADVMANELRGCAALVIAGLSAKGRTRVAGGEFADRGYENLCRDLTELGAKIAR